MYPTLDFLPVDLEYDRLLLQEEIPAQEASSVVPLRNRSGFLFLLASTPCPFAKAEGGGDLKYYAGVGWGMYAATVKYPAKYIKSQKTIHSAYKHVCKCITLLATLLMAIGIYWRPVDETDKD